VQAGLGVIGVDDIALSVLASVIGHQRDKGWILIDAGWMACRAIAERRGTGGPGLWPGGSADGVPWPI
jgi:D-serine deaminase-like pyridoxal phosphate-dependent protein